MYEWFYYTRVLVVLCILGTRVALIMHNVLLASIIYYYIIWPRNWPLRRLRPFSPFPTKGAAKSAPCAPRGVRG